MLSCASTLIARRTIGCATRGSRRIGLDGGRSRRRAGLGRPPRDGWRETRAARAFQHVLRQLAELLQRRPRHSVLRREVVAGRAGIAVLLGQGEQAAQRMRAVVEPAFQRAAVDQRRVVGEDQLARQVHLKAQPRAARLAGVVELVPALAHAQGPAGQPGLGASGLVELGLDAGLHLTKSGNATLPVSVYGNLNLTLALNSANAVAIGVSGNWNANANLANLNLAAGLGYLDSSISGGSYSVTATGAFSNTSFEPLSPFPLNLTTKLTS